jgi:MFS superfamily sulfate permease-like transporter
MNIPQAMGYARIAGMPVITGLYTLLLPVVAFAAFGSSRFLVVASDSATAAILAGGLAGMASVSSAQYISLALKDLVHRLAQQGVTLVFAHVSQTLQRDLDRQGLTEVIGPNRLFETWRECLAAYEGSAEKYLDKD